MQIFCRRKNTQKHAKNAQADYAITLGHAFGMFQTQAVNYPRITQHAKRESKPKGRFFYVVNQGILVI